MCPFNWPASEVASDCETGKPYLAYARTRPAGPPRGLLFKDDPWETLKASEQRQLANRDERTAKARRYKEASIMTTSVERLSIFDLYDFRFCWGWWRLRLLSRIQPARLFIFERETLGQGSLEILPEKVKFTLCSSWATRQMDIGWDGPGQGEHCRKECILHTPWWK